MWSLKELSDEINLIINKLKILTPNLTMIIFIKLKKYFLKNNGQLKTSEHIIKLLKK